MLNSDDSWRWRKLLAPKRVESSQVIEKYSTQIVLLKVGCKISEYNHDSRWLLCKNDLQFYLVLLATSLFTAFYVLLSTYYTTTSFVLKENFGLRNHSYVCTSDWGYVCLSFITVNRQNYFNKFRLHHLMKLRASYTLSSVRPTWQIWGCLKWNRL